MESDVAQNYQEEWSRMATDEVEADSGVSVSGGDAIALTGRRTL